MQDYKYTNELIHETSPYLLQHAHNPVDWYPWGDTALKRAREENKLLLISIGYSACHWCHVMEHESFEDPEVAKLMNRQFVCIKVDREERPDVDHTYMSAVQLLSGRGGWPLNSIALPDGRPIWAGTYFRKEEWMEALDAIANFYHENPEKTEEYAAKLHDGMQQSALIAITPVGKTPIDSSFIKNLLAKWRSQFDIKHGGTKGAPKFMLPNNWQFLLRAGVHFQDKKILDQIRLTLIKMAFGGIYDQAGGGFARYSTDELWKVPHFEKMLYDNAQLLGLYANAWKVEQHPVYRQVVEETVEFLQREMLSPENGFYSALDADSEGVEGKYYVWSKEELEMIMGYEFPLFSAYYNINTVGLWENNEYILMRTEENEAFATWNKLTLEELNAKLKHWKSLLLTERNKRVRPGLDDKILASWNALAISGLVTCYNAFGNEHYLDLALKNARFLKEKMFDEYGQLFHSYKNNQAKIHAFLEDYALLIEAFIALFESTGEKSWLEDAARLTDITLAGFYDKGKYIFSFTSADQTDLVTPTYEVHDNVIPASNSVMARNLYRLSWLLDRSDYRDISRAMLQGIAENINAYPSGYTNWCQLILDLTVSHLEVAVTGPDAISVLKDLQQKYMPQVTFCAGTSEDSLPLLKDRMVEGKTLIYICQDSTCQLPVKSADKAIELIQKLSLVKVESD